MERVSEILLQFFYVFKEAPFKFLVFIVMCAGLFIIYDQTEAIISYLPDPEKENAQFELTLERDALINQALQTSLEFLNADAVVISQFHNGQYDLTRLPFTKVTATYYAGDTGIAPTSLYTARPISSMNKLMLNMWADKESPQCVAKTVESLLDLGYRQRLQDAGKVFISVCPLVNLRNYPIGYYAVSYSHVPEPEEVEKLLEYQKTLASRMAGYLQEGVVKNDRDKTWLR